MKKAAVIAFIVIAACYGVFGAKSAHNLGNKISSSIQHRMAVIDAASN